MMKPECSNYLLLASYEWNLLDVTYNFSALKKSSLNKDILSPVKKSSIPRESTPPGSPHPALLAKISGK